MDIRIYGQVRVDKKMHGHAIRTAHKRGFGFQEHRNLGHTVRLAPKPCRNAHGSFRWVGSLMNYGEKPKQTANTLLGFASL